MQDMIKSVCLQLDEILKSVLKIVHKFFTLGEFGLTLMSSQ